MHCKSFISPFVALSLGLQAYCLSHAVDDSLTLLPINIRDFDATAGIQRRASEDFSDLDPTTQARLIYGRPGENGQLLLADMTLHASDGLDIVMMENFEGLTKKVDCKGDDGSMSLTFKSEEAFNQALKKWSFIKDSEEERFLLIANHDGCGPDDERQPYLITNLREDKSTLTTFLTAQVAQWSEVAGNFDIDFGKVVTKPVSRRRVKDRGFIGDLGNDIKGGISSIADKFRSIGTTDVTRTVAFPISVSKPGVKTNIVDNEEKHIKIDCINCFIAGKFQVTGHLTVEKFKIQDFVIESSPQDVKAELELETTVSASQELFSIDEAKELFAFGIPDAGIAVTGIFKLGATLSYSVGVSSSFKGEGVVDFGLAASLPNSAKITADAKNKDKNSAVGFEGASFDPIFDVKSLSASIDLIAYSKARIVFGIDVTKIGKLDVAVTLQVPKVTTTLTAAFEEQGVCSTGPGSSKTGVKLDSQIALEVDLDLDANFGSGSTPAKTFQLFNVSKPLLAKCFSINIPGLGPVSPPDSALPPPVTPTAAPSTTLIPSPSPPTNPTATAGGFPSGIGSGVPIPIPTGSAVIPSQGFPTLISLKTAPTGQPSGGPVPSGLLPRGSFRGPYYPIRR
ncbi:hypothetical protein MMC22_000511 [Lobaria immixta]|nr:hypothetical protein [Lobaria immixta]